MNIPGYQIEKLIAEGGMASVYLARQESLARLVALKLLRKFDNPSQALRFFNEGRIIASLEHHNIITIFDLGVVGERHYLAMEFLQGGDLKTRINNGMSPSAALELVETLGLCLSFVHQKGIIHRDIKPENILFRQDGTVVLTDFGVAKQMASDNTLTMDGATFGSPHYLSPEQAACKPLDGRADIYSLGIVLYEMLTGLKPFQGDSPLEVIIAHLASEAPLLPPNLAYCQALLSRMIAQDPNDRFASADELVDAVRLLRATAPKHMLLKSAAPRGGADKPSAALTQTLAQSFVTPNIAPKAAPYKLKPGIRTGFAGAGTRTPYPLKEVLHKLISSVSRQVNSKRNKPDNPASKATAVSNQDSLKVMLYKTAAGIGLIVTVLLGIFFLRQPVSPTTRDQPSYTQNAVPPQQPAQDMQTAISTPQVAQDTPPALPPLQTAPMPNASNPSTPDSNNALLQGQDIGVAPQTPTPPAVAKKPELSAKAARRQAAAILKEKNLTLSRLRQAYDLYQITLKKDPRNVEALHGISTIAHKFIAIKLGQRAGKK